jgi:Glycosyltransferases involved in cell wall biogenesis
MSEITEHPEWSVPSFETIFTGERSSDACVIIPIINEGERVLTQLKGMQALGIEKKADIMLADGGSTDGSTEQVRLKSLGVNWGVLKTGGGKLYAQLRMAYAFALRQGFEQIVTMDGNNKDDPDTIPAFIDAIKRGCDLCRPRRYLPGAKKSALQA